jgi:hypothetical protein
VSLESLSSGASVYHALCKTHGLSTFTPSSAQFELSERTSLEFFF